MKMETPCRTTRVARKVALKSSPWDSNVLRGRERAHSHSCVRKGRAFLFCFCFEDIFLVFHLGIYIFLVPSAVIPDYLHLVSFAGNLNK